MSIGFFKIHREMMDPDSWVSSLSYHDRWLAVMCINKANFKDGEWFDGKTIIEIPRGSFVTTVDKLRISLGSDSSTKKVRRGLAKLRAAKFISFGQSKGQRYTILTVRNYSRYQDREPEGGNERGVKGATKGAPKGQYEGNKGATIEEGKKERREEERSKPRFDFELHYQNYPKKQGKSAGLAKLKKLIKTEAEFKRFAVAMEQMQANWEGSELTYCPMFSSYVNARTWEDETQPAPSKEVSKYHNPASSRGKRL